MTSEHLYRRHYLKKRLLRIGIRSTIFWDYSAIQLWIDFVSLFKITAWVINCMWSRLGIDEPHQSTSGHQPPKFVQRPYKTILNSSTRMYSSVHTAATRLYTHFVRHRAYSTYSILCIIAATQHWICTYLMHGTSATATRSSPPWVSAIIWRWPKAGYIIIITTTALQRPFWVRMQACWFSSLSLSLLKSHPWSE